MVRLFVAALLFSAQSSAAFAQTLSGGDLGPDVSIWRVVAALVLCLALAAGAVFALRHRLGVGGSPLAFFASGQRRMQLLEAIRPHPATAICLVRCDGKDYLIAVGPQGGSLIDRIDATKSTEESP
jgi:hypothetical protein